MSASDWRGVLILPLLVFVFFCVGEGMVVGSALAGFAAGFCVVAGRGA